MAERVPLHVLDENQKILSRFEVKLIHPYSFGFRILDLPDHILLSTKDVSGEYGPLLALR